MINNSISFSRCLLNASNCDTHCCTIEEAEGGAILPNPFSLSTIVERFETFACAYVRLHSTSKISFADYVAACAYIPTHG